MNRKMSLFASIFFAAAACAVHAQDLELPEVTGEKVDKVADAVKKNLPGGKKGSGKAAKGKKDDKAAKGKGEAQTEEKKPDEPKTDGNTVAKKPPKKKKKVEPVSEYKFKMEEDKPVYKLDKRANPIIKETKPKKKAVKKAEPREVTPPEDLAPVEGPPIPQKKLPRQPPPEDFIE